MKQITLLVLLLIISASAFSKDYDLIVFPNGDSIACKIDSITDTDIYFAMKNKYHWLSTHQKIGNIAYYELDAIRKKSIVFKPGTSYIIPLDKKPQGGVSLKAGIGFPELLNGSIRLEANYYKLGLTFGGLPAIDNESMFSISGDVYFPLGKKFLLKKKQPLCGRIGLSYFRDESEKYRDTYLHLNLRAGRDFMFSEKLGMEIYFGMMIQLHYEHIQKESMFLTFSMSEAPVLPSGGVGIFYRF